MSNDQHITLRQDELAAYQRAIETAKGTIARLEAELRAAESDALALRTTAQAYVTSATYEERARLRAELEVLATVEHPGVLLAKELEAARAVINQVRWAVENHYAPPPLCDALTAYDTAMKEGR